jgi:hypothetical protein
LKSAASFQAAMLLIHVGSLKISIWPFVVMGCEKPAEGQICVPETPSQNPAGKGENRQGINNEGNHKFDFQ